MKTVLIVLLVVTLAVAAGVVLNSVTFAGKGNGPGDGICTPNPDCPNPDGPNQDCPKQCCPKQCCDDGDGIPNGQNEEQVTLDQVPQAVKATILAEAEGGTIKEIERETKNGKTVYEADVILSGKEVEIKVASDGTLLAKEVEDADDDDDHDGDDDDDR